LLMCDLDHIMCDPIQRKNALWRSILDQAGWPSLVSCGVRTILTGYWRRTRDNLG
jgi:hypothetical protein